jgi:predicted RNA-binding protein with PIN domain
MPFLIDGSNVLGAMGADRHADGPKRDLVRVLSRFARARKTRVTLVFDGSEPASFAKSLGPVSVAFGEGRSADDLIAERAAQGRGWSVVTSDRGLAARVQRRQVEIVSPQAFLRDLESIPPDETSGTADWDAYFSDPKNRLKF